MYFDENNLNDCFDYIKNMTIPENHTLIIFIAEKSVAILNDLREILIQQDIEFVGGIFPMLLVAGTMKTQGVALTIVSTLVKPICIDLDALNIPDVWMNDFSNQLKQIDYHPLMMIIATNSLNNNNNMSFVASYIESVFGDTVSYIGGGAGKATLDETPTVFDNEDVYMNTVLLIPINRANSTRSTTGWIPIGKFHTVTKTNDAILVEVNNKKAIDWFLNEYEALRGKKIDRSAINHDLDLHIGVHTKSSGYVMRAIVDQTPEGGIVLGVPVKNNSLLTLMEMSPQIINLHTSRMLRLLKQDIQNINQTFVVECITRPLVLKENFDRELSTIETILGDDVLNDSIGFVAIGEFGRVKNHTSLEFLNESLVVAIT